MAKIAYVIGVVGMTVISLAYNSDWSAVAAIAFFIAATTKG